MQMLHGSTLPELVARGINWQNHTDGVIKLLESQGPRQSASKDAHILFLWHSSFRGMWFLPTLLLSATDA